MTSFRVAALSAACLLLCSRISHAACPSMCSGHGTCGSGNACTCFDGWTAADCKQRASYSVLWGSMFFDVQQRLYYTPCHSSLRPFLLVVSKCTSYVPFNCPSSPQGHVPRVLCGVQRQPQQTVLTRQGSLQSAHEPVPVTAPLECASVSLGSKVTLVREVSFIALFM
jgi:hypothetical protein